MSKRIGSDLFDVLVIGGGAAGLYTALSLPAHLRIALVTKDTLKQSASDWAQGGIAAAIRHDDSPEFHARDTFNAGAELCEPSAVEYLVHRAKAQIENLLEMGVTFDRQQQELALTLEAAHSKPRVLHSADTTGRALIKTLTHQIFLRSNIEVLVDFFSLDLLIHPKSHRCCGVIGVYDDQVVNLCAHAVVLATGGGGQVFSETTNPLLSTGDGVAMAWRAGARLRDLEFFQFHPTALKSPGAPRFLITEAVRGEGAHLIDHQGDRFMPDYHELGELAPRDVVSRSIVDHLSKTQQDNVWLDLRPISSDKIRYRFPKIIQVCRSWDIDVFNKPIPVAPAAHYWMGGVQTNLGAKTSIDGLYAVGEVASTGVHGANRLASNSLMECLVFGASLAESITVELTRVNSQTMNPRVTEYEDALMLSTAQLGEAIDFATMRQDLARCMWRCAGITRERQTLESALETVHQMQQSMPEGVVPVNQKQQPSNPEDIDLSRVRSWGETRNLLDVSNLILKSCLFRCESRGGHFRIDFPQTDANWLVHSIIEKDLIKCVQVATAEP
ncbi:MAG: L-aspartate oxidase [Cyanobacteria bacterium P01_F01_bin.42]